MNPAFLILRYSLIAVLFLTPAMTLHAGETVIHPLFKIERSKNANIIQYDALAGADRKLLAKKPVDGYWVRLAEQGQRKELTWLQKTFAFGFKTTLAENRESATLDMAVDIGSPISVIRVDDRYRATIPIDGSVSYLERIYIKATGSGLSVKLIHIELFGTDVNDGDNRYQKIQP